MKADRTPKDLSITPRNLAFNRGHTMDRWWNGGDPVATAFYNSLSLTFPQGEAYFVQSVRRYIDEVPEPLRSQVDAFAKQEAYHSREHMAFNRLVSNAGFDGKRIDDLIREDTRALMHHPAETHLAVTAALEHFTAVFAHTLLSDKRHLADCPQEIARLWQWHAVEEIEHKSVAFDTFMHVTRDLSPFNRWLFRVASMWQATGDFWKERKRDIGILFDQDGMNTPRTWRRLGAFLFWKPGLLRQILFPYLGYYLPGFHPWHFNDHALAKNTERALQLEPTGVT